MAHDHRSAKWCWIAWAVLSSVLATCGVSRADLVLVDNGEPRAEIVIADQPPRLVKVAATELKTYLEKLSGAKLPIVTTPSKGDRARIYVGQSPQTARLGVTDEGLRHGAFRIVSGPDWLVLLGHDFDFTPKGPAPMRREDIPASQAEWDRMTGHTWLNPTWALFKWRHHEHGFWSCDEGGSLNAVYEFLRMQGVRWYLPGELGEIVPQVPTIRVASINQTVLPDSAVRHFYWSCYGCGTWDNIIWERRLGLNSAYETLGAAEHLHGLANVHGHEEMQRSHPEYFALVGGQRDTTSHGTGHECFSSEGLFRETVAYARAVFDIYGDPAVSVWPEDGFRACQCELCRGKTPSEQVWGFVDRVARELYKTHPDKLVTCGAYTPFTEPPEGIDEFSPNVLVFVASALRSGLDNPQRWEEYQNRIEAWQKKVTPGNLIRISNNLYSLRAGKEPLRFLPVHPHITAKDLKLLKGLSRGDWNEVSRVNLGPDKQQVWRAPGADHLNLYVQARLLWDADQDLDALLEEYYGLFYGPARVEMQAAFEFAEANYNRHSKNPADVDPSVSIRLMEMLQKAHAVAGDGVYGQRIQLLLDELRPIERLRDDIQAQEAANRARAKGPLAKGRDAAQSQQSGRYFLKDVGTGEKAAPETSFRVLWDRRAIVFKIHCQEPDMPHLNVTDDVFGGDCVAILLETPDHSYYQIEIGPDGKVFDADRKFGIDKTWASLAQVRTQRGKDYWEVEVRIPVVTTDEGAADPIHNVVGSKPTRENPWYFTVGRARVRGTQRDLSAFVPTGNPTYHDRKKFARLVIE
jgi:hypothetical protein